MKDGILTLLRSVIDVGGTVTQENLSANFQRLTTSRIEFVRPEDQRIVSFLRDYFGEYLELPQVVTVNDYFERAQDLEAIERLKDIEAVTAPLIRTGYTHLLSGILEEQSRQKALLLFQKAKQIVERGLEDATDGEKVKLFGVRAAVSYVSQHAADLVTAEHNAKLEGNLRDDGQAVWDEYQSAKLNKHLVWGKFCGLNAIDTICRGIKRGELWIHAAFAGELKTGYAINWSYNLVTRYRSNVAYVSLEMPYEQLRRMIYVVHSANAKFKVQGFRPLDYRKVRDGELTPEEELFYQLVIKDFTSDPTYGSFKVWRPASLDVTIDEIKLQAELFHRQDELSLLVVDHSGLVEPRKKKRNKDYGVEINSVIRDMKKLAMNFNAGEGLGLLLLHQMNRQGKDEADKNEGRYKAKALSYANEAEKSADVITTTYLNEEHRKNGTTIFCNLKNRDNPLVEPFLAAVDFGCRRLSNLDALGSPGNGMSLDDNRSAIENMFG